MPVYFIRAGDTGPVKIGWAEDVEKRRKQLQTSQPYPLYVLRTITGARGTERWLHRHYEAEQLLGEWFAFRDDMLSVEPPDLGEPPPPKQKKPPLDPWEKEWAARRRAEMCSPGIGDPCDGCRVRRGLPLRPYRLTAE